MPLLFKNVGLWLGPYAFKSKANKVELDYSVEEKDVTNLGDTTARMLPGMKKVGCSIDGFVDFGDLDSGTYVEPILNAWIEGAGEIPITVSEPGAGGTAGQVCFLTSCYSSNANPMTGGVGDVHAFSVKFFPAVGALCRGVIGLPQATYASASGNGTAYQLGAVAETYKLYASLHMLDVGAGGSVVVEIESDDNAGMTSATSRLTFTAATDATAEFKSVAGPITDDYWRVKYTRTGGSNFVAVVSMGVGPA